MGLDNAICIKRNEYTNTIPELKQFEADWDEEKRYDFEVCYWRKCWNIRSMVAWNVENFVDCMDGGETKLSTTDIDNIIKGLQSYNADSWQKDGGSIWEWDNEEWSYSVYVKQNIKDLQTLRKLMDKYDLEVYFYDSY